MPTPDVRVPFLSLRPGEDADALRAAVGRVIDRGWFILGPELEAFEQDVRLARRPEPGLLEARAALEVVESIYRRSYADHAGRLR